MFLYKLGNVCNLSAGLEVRDRKVPVAHWPATLTKSTLHLIERPDLRKVELSQGGCPVPTFGHTHTNGIFFLNLKELRFLNLVQARLFPGPEIAKHP